MNLRLAPGPHVKHSGALTFPFYCKSPVWPDWFLLKTWEFTFLSCIFLLGDSAAFLWYIFAEIHQWINIRLLRSSASNGFIPRGFAHNFNISIPLSTHHHLKPHTQHCHVGKSKINIPAISSLSSITCSENIWDLTRKLLNSLTCNFVTNISRHPLSTYFLGKHTQTKKNQNKVKYVKHIAQSEKIPKCHPF